MLKDIFIGWNRFQKSRFSVSNTSKKFPLSIYAQIPKLRNSFVHNELNCTKNLE